MIYFIITIDTEGDNIWSCPEKVTTTNAQWLPRFQQLCEEYAFKPTYLVNHEMAKEPEFRKLGRSVLNRGAGEIGLHIHAWDSPPIVEVGYDTKRHHTYLYELPDQVMHDKIGYLTRLLNDVFDVKPMSHRAGRWGFDERVARALAEMGYLVDCSVTPGVSWRGYKGDPDGRGGPDFYDFPVGPYLLDLSDIRRSGLSNLLEVPVTIKSNYQSTMRRFHHRIEDSFPGAVLRRALGPPCSWLRPNGKNIEAMYTVVDWAIERQLPVLEFMLHSSELMPGGSPTFKTAEQIELLYHDLRSLFAHIASKGIRGLTLSEYRVVWG